MTQYDCLLTIEKRKDESSYLRETWGPIMRLGNKLTLTEAMRSNSRCASMNLGRSPQKT